MKKIMMEVSVIVDNDTDADEFAWSVRGELHDRPDVDWCIIEEVTEHEFPMA